MLLSLLLLSIVSQLLSAKHQFFCLYPRTLKNLATKLECVL